MKRISFIILALIISSACAPRVDIDLGKIIQGEDPTVSINDVEIEPDVLTAIRSGPLINEDLGSCILSDFSFNPQPFRVRGTPFRVRGTPFRVRGTSDEILVDGVAAIAASSIGKDFQTTLADFIDGNVQEDVGIVVLDDFGEATYFLDSIMFEVEELLPEMLIEFETQGFSSHGALVMNHMNGVLEGLGTFELANVSAGTVTWQHKDTGKKLVIKAAVPNDFETGEVAAALGDAISSLRAEGINNIVTNMSFIILPCSIVKDFVVQKIIYPSLFDYLATVVEDNVRAVMNRQNIPAILTNEVAEQVSTLVIDALKPVDTEGDPLRLAMLAEPNVLFVGAAGNFGRDVAAYPAAWDEVLAVSASLSGEKADFSNTGDVMVAGAWFQLGNPAGLNGDGLSSSSVVYAGTSFAAPAVSVFSALDLANGGRCALEGSLPRLANSGKDIELEQVVKANCF